MTLKEFYQRTGVEVKSYEFDAIHTMYMMSELDKDEFCQMWCKMNYNRVADAKARAKREMQKDIIRRKTYPILSKIQKQIEKYNITAEIYKCAILTEKEKNFLLDNNLADIYSFDCSAGTLNFIIKTNLNCI